ncbi:MAG: hypothetical protein ACO1SV_23815 [Fimbriimonas sp.]
MALIAACLLAFLAPPAIEVAICDAGREVSWRPDGTPTKGYAPKIWDADRAGVLSAKPNHRIILVRTPARGDDVPDFFFQLPNGGRYRASSVLTRFPERRYWVAILPMPLSAAKDEGLYEVGIADGDWKTSGSKWPKKGIVRGEAFNVHAARKPRKGADAIEVWGITSNLPLTPRHLAWRLLPYDAKGREMRPAGSIRLAGRPHEWFFTGPGTKRADVTRIDLQRRPIRWTKFAKFELEGPK